MIKWKDAASYSIGSVRTHPQVLDAIVQLGDGHEFFRFSVHKYIGDKEHWFLTCHDLNITNYILLSKEIDVAKTEATQLIKNKILATVVYYQKILDKF